MSADTELLVVDGLQGIVGVDPVLDALPAERPRALPLSREDILAKLAEWEADYVAGQAENTIKALRSDWNQYLAWCEGTRTAPLPLSVIDLIAYANSMIDRNKKRATIDRHLFSIGTIHDAAGLPNPVKQPLFRRKFKACIKRLVTLGNNGRTQARPLSRKDIDSILNTLNLDRMVHLRDAALISLAADTLCRESELVAATVEQLEPNDLDGSISFNVGKSKANQEGDDDFRFVSPETLALIDAWRARAGITTGPLFVAVAGRKKASSTPSHDPRVRSPMNAQEVARIFQKRAAAAGIALPDPPAHDGAAAPAPSGRKGATARKKRKVSGHSTRVGGANELALAGESLQAIADAGGWADLKQVMLYTEHSRVGLGAQARLRAKRLQQADEPPGDA